jgi:hypothetical protein
MREIERTLWGNLRCFARSSKGGKQQEDQFMRTSILAIIVAFGTTIVVPALAQQQPTPGQQEEADKGIKTRNSGESGYVSEQEKPGASSHAPGQPDTKSNQTTTGTSSAVGKSGGVSVGEQEKKPATSPAESNQTTSGKPR